ncbi:uncharacterized protein FMAN_12896 [Fusarium mangiferae]|uniref:Uncharacterized protein n=1 Tax=Fusarium mangiferae TaxID=192010 RepID=A0A1L7U262_FUSMA|nr:uncharacterized protein FMAN_12896 [Fusarium mangiferae]CVL04838.1 uncharacterized protein FMAN_12896 [Fusarium mangiferae]
MAASYNSSSRLSCRHPSHTSRGNDADQRHVEPSRGRNGNVGRQSRDPSSSQCKWRCDNISFCHKSRYLFEHINDSSRYVEMLKFRTMTSRNAYLSLVGVWLLVCHRVTLRGLDGSDGHDHLGNFHCLILNKNSYLTDRWLAILSRALTVYQAIGSCIASHSFPVTPIFSLDLGGGASIWTRVQGPWLPAYQCMYLGSSEDESISCNYLVHHRRGYLIHGSAQKGNWIRPALICWNKRDLAT